MIVRRVRRGEKIVRRLKCAAAVEIIGVDRGKIALDLIRRAQYRVRRAPGLYAPLRNAIAVGQAIDGLIGVFQIHGFGDAIADGGAEIRRHFRLDDADHLTEARANRIVNGIIDDDVAAIIHGGDLLASAEAAAHARRHNYKRWFFHSWLPFIFSVFCRRIRSCRIRSAAARIPVPRRRPAALD